MTLDERDQRRRIAEQLARFVEGTSDRAVMLLSDSGTVTAWTQGAERLFGWPAAEIVGLRADRLYPACDRDADRLSCDLAAAMTISPMRCEQWRVRRDGSEFLAEVTLVALRDEADAPCGFGQSIEDITQRHAVEQARRQSELHIRSILATVPDAMVVIDDRGVILSFSSAAERLFGYREADVQGRNVSLLMPGPEGERHDDYIARYERTGERRIIGIGRVVTGQRRDGTSFPMELSVAEARGEYRRIFTGFIRDLTAQQRAELSLKELQAELIHVSRSSAMGTMASTLAHELNQPLAAASLYLEAGRDLIDNGDASGSPDLRQALDEAARECLRAGQIVRRLRDFVARGTTERCSQDIAPLIEDAARLGLLGSRERSIRLFTEFDPAAGAVFVDRVQIQQVLVNLLRNAAEAVADCERRDITVSVRADGPMVRISVADTGKGFDPTIASHMFEAFASGKEGGMGLGLSICRTIVEAHGGRITAQSSPDGGAMVLFTLPVAEPGAETGAETGAEMEAEGVDD
jgi:two-component system sensor kinase FixL